MSPEPKEWWAVFAGADLCGVRMTDGPFSDRALVEKLYKERVEEDDHRNVYLVKIEKGLEQ